MVYFVTKIEKAFILCFYTVFNGKERELVALFSLSSWSQMIVVCLFFAMPWACLQFVIVVFPDQSHLLFWKYSLNSPYTKLVSCGSNKLTMVWFYNKFIVIFFHIDHSYIQFVIFGNNSHNIYC